MWRVTVTLAAYVACTGIYAIPILYTKVVDGIRRAVVSGRAQEMEMSFGDFVRMDDEELTTLLLSLAISCPIDLPKYCCPIVEFRRFTSCELSNWLKHLHRREKIAIAARHYGCAKWHERH
jgi:hypothetical protein